jgi:glutamate 5-kinase
MRRAVVVKLGSSTLVDGRRRLRRARLARLASELVELQLSGTPVCVVSSGAIALGLGALGRDVRPGDVPSLQAASAVGQGLLAGAWQRALVSAGGRSAQVLLTADDVRRRTSYLNARATLEALLAWDVVPIVNENDSTATDEITFGDNDALAAQVALLLRARLLVLLTDADGLYTRDPRATGAQLVSEVHDRALLAGLELDGASTSGLGSGGMRSKVVAASMAAGGGVACVIASGAAPGTIARAVAGKPVGTRFSPARRPVSAWKLWLRYGKPPSGRVFVDAGARTALLSRGASLLPVGVQRVEGTFRAGDAVRICTLDGVPFATGVVAMGSAELRRAAGQHSAVAGVPEAIHRDNLVLHDGSDD